MGLFREEYRPLEEKPISHDQMIASIQKFHCEMQAWQDSREDAHQRYEKQKYAEGLEEKIEDCYEAAQYRLLSELIEAHGSMFDDILCYKKI